MTKRKSGLRKNYKLSIDTVGLSGKPLSPPGYLDVLDDVVEVAPPAEDRSAAQRHGIEEPAGKAPAVSTVSEQQMAEQADPLTPQSVAMPSPSPKAQQPRRNIGVNTATDSQIEWVLEHFRQHSPARAKCDLQPADMLRALMAILHEARMFIDASTLPRRGKYGTGKAAIFDQTVIRIFKSAIQQNLH